MIYFVSGHRDLTQKEFDELYKDIIETAASKRNTKFIVADYEGADIMCQQLLKTLCDKNIIDYSSITIYHMGHKPMRRADNRFNLKGGFESDIERDSAMTRDSQKDIAFIRKGKWTSGTAQNILRRYELLEYK